MSDKTEVLSFDEWYNTYDNLQCDKDACEDAFEAGQQSKQSEIDHLQKRLDEAMELLEHVDSALQALEILKGEETK